MKNITSINCKKLFLSLTFLFTFTFFSNGIIYSQVEYVSPEDPVYSFLKRMQVRGVIPDYNSSNLPLSREKISSFLDEILSSEKINSNDKSQAEFYSVEYDIEKNIRNSRVLLSERNRGYLSDGRPNYLYTYNDSNVNLFVNGLGGVSYTNSFGDSLNKSNITFGSAGIELRGTMYNTLGFYLKAINTAKLAGDDDGRELALNTNKRVRSDWKFERGENFYSYFEGYLRYRTIEDWFSLSIGRFPITQGFGYVDKMFVSDNIAPFDIIKLDLSYKNISYTFMYGALRGDSLGRKLDAKNIASHRLNLAIGNRLKIGLTETIISANSPFNLSLLNPFSILTVAELNKASQGSDDNINNGIIGIDVEYSPIENISLQGGFLVDDLELSTLFKENSKITNKFGYQFGFYWADFLTLRSLDFVMEYTRLDPFVYTHTSNKTDYTHWGLPIGHSTPPNSDVISVKFNYNYKSFLYSSIELSYRRHAFGIETDSTGKLIVNYGGNIENGRYNNVVPVFLAGNRVNSTHGKFNLTIQPLRNYFIHFDLFLNNFDKVYLNSKSSFNYAVLGFNVKF